MKYRSTFILLLISFALKGQVVNTASMDTANYKLSGKLTVEGYLDTYYSYNFNKPASLEQPYLVSMARHNEVNVNLAVVDIKYSSSRVRGRIAPGFGTYINANYANESGTLKNFIEANGGYRVSKIKNIWIDVGVLSSPYTNESAISKDQLTYTRSLSAENVPYYLSGIKLTVPFSKQINGYFYLVNGWQQINDQNTGKAIGTQLEWRPNNFLLINWNTFIGKEQSAIDSIQGLRSFTDLYCIFNKERWSFTSCVYLGQQASGSHDRIWWQANVVARYSISTMVSASGRFEYFQDADGVVIIPLAKASEFKTYGTSLGINLTPDANLMVRTELRYFFSRDHVFQKEGLPSRNSLSLTASACIWF